MSDQSSQNQAPNDEIDLSLIFDKIKSLFKSLLLGVVLIFQFFWKHKIRLIILIIIGVGLQFLLVTQIKKVYVNEFLVRTNFGSTEYLYSKANSINAKLNSKDTLFLKGVFGADYERVKELEIVPVVDVYSLVNKSEENKETFELLLDEYGDLSFLEKQINVNEYPTHKIKVFIKGPENNEEISTKLYNFLSDNPYYNDLKLTALENYKERLEQNKAIRAQIDSIILDQREHGMLPELKDNAITFKGSQNLNELLREKRALLENDLILRNQLSSNDEVLKPIHSSFGVFSEERNWSPFIISILLAVIYILFFFFKYLSKKISRIIN